MRWRLAVVLLIAASLASAAGRPFEDLVKAIEKHFDTTRTRVPGMGWANLALMLAHPGGAREVHIALFRDLQVDPNGERQQELDRFMDGLASPELRPLIRTRSHEREDATYIFSGEVGKTTQLLLATFHGRQATVVEVRVDLDTLMRWIQSPEMAGREVRQDHDW